MAGAAVGTIVGFAAVCGFDVASREAPAGSVLAGGCPDPTEVGWATELPPGALAGFPALANDEARMSPPMMMTAQCHHFIRHDLTVAVDVTAGAEVVARWLRGTPQCGQE
jgi:hypothetical protein